ncbi:MAG: EamA family transporter [Candidatus Doudnabacteria bacterium]|nr:EamA family transporter [Candidatus Doudnabacteria bacterium]
MLIYGILFTGLIATVAAQILMKHGMNRLGEIPLTVQSVFQLVPKVISSPYLLLGLVCLGLGFLLWLVVLSRLKLSVAIPFASVNYVLILFFSWLVLKESISPLQILGVGLIAVGLFFVTR